MYVVTDSNTGAKFDFSYAGQALVTSMEFNMLDEPQPLNQAIVTALHWIEYQEDN